MKIFEFEHSEGAEIIVAENAKEAVTFFFLNYMDDVQIDEMLEFDGVKIRQVDAIEVIANRKLYNEEKGAHELVSYQKLAEEAYKGTPEVLVSPSY